MRSFVLAFFFLLFCCPVFGQSCGNNDECKFVRGDANCDGNINMTDVIAISGGTYSNADAADVDDSGSITAVDPTYLLNYLYNAGPPPAYPFPGADFDCTTDFLNECCSTFLTFSPVTTPSLQDRSYSALDWDVFTPDLGDNKFRVRNEVNCDHPDAVDVCRVRANVADPTGFTGPRLGSGVQNATLTVTVSAAYEVGDACVTPCFPSVAQLYVDVGSAVVHVGVTGSTGINADGSWDDTYDSVSINRTGTSYQNCSVVPYFSEPPVFTFSADITDQLADLSSTCATKRITSIELRHIIVGFSVMPSDVITDEGITIDVDFDIDYDFCDA